MNKANAIKNSNKEHKLTVDIDITSKYPPII